MKTETIKIDLNSPQGNAFNLLGVARKLSKQMGLNTTEIYREMTISDYENLIKTFEKYFGNYVTLQNKP
jgi:hypothetical protein